MDSKEKYVKMWENEKLILILKVTREYLTED